MKCTYLGGLPAVQVPGSVGTTWYGPGIGPTLMNNVAWTASHPPGDKLKWKALCGHLMPTEYADYVTYVFGFVHVWCCHKFVYPTKFLKENIFTCVTTLWIWGSSPNVNFTKQCYQSIRNDVKDPLNI